MGIACADVVMTKMKAAKAINLYMRFSLRFFYSRIVAGFGSTALIHVKIISDQSASSRPLKLGQGPIASGPTFACLIDGKKECAVTAPC
jgi:hypothetical protein